MWLINVKSGITYTVSHNYEKIKASLFDSSPLEKTVTFCNVIVYTKSVWNKDKSNYYYNKFLEKTSNEFPKK